MMNKSLLTIIIPTLNRSELLIRLLNYLAQTNYRHSVAIGDSSDPFHVGKTKEAIEKIGEKLRIVYKECPGYSCYAAQKLLIQSVDTPYIVSLPDDDFLVPSGLDKCIDFLENHPDYIAAHGYGIIAILRSDELHGKDLAIGNYRQPIIENEHAKERLLELLGNYSVAAFSVHRTAAFEIMWSDEIADYSFGELLPCCLSAILGKIKQLECFYLVRQLHDKRYLSPDSYDWITSSQWQSSYKVFQDCLTRELSKQESIALDEAREVVKQGFWGYLGRGLSSRYYLRYRGENHSTGAVNIKNMVVVIKKRLKTMPLIFDALRSLSRSVRWSKDQWPDFSLGALLNPRSPYHNDFMPVYGAITSILERTGDAAGLHRK